MRDPLGLSSVPQVSAIMRVPRWLPRRARHSYVLANALGLPPVLSHQAGRQGSHGGTRRAQAQRHRRGRTRPPLSLPLSQHRVTLSAWA